MSITDELRAWVARKFPVIDKEWHEEFTAIADRIDAEHERAEQDLIDANNQMEQLCECSIGLPVDADGEYIHIGDVMEGEKIGGGYGEPFEVVGYVMSNGELEPMDEHRNQRKRKYSRHHHAPTVEDVLREFGDWYAHVKGGCDEDGIIAEYATKLRLAEEDA